MRKSATDYSRTVIYRIVCKDVSVCHCYIGSTTNFNARVKQHRFNCKNAHAEHHHYKVYRIIRENGGFDNWDVVLVEVFPCENALEAHKRERYWLEFYGATMNSQVPSRIDKEYYLENRARIIKRQTIYATKHAEQIKQYQAGWWAKNKERVNQRKRERTAQIRALKIEYPLLFSQTRPPVN